MFPKTVLKPKNIFGFFQTDLAILLKHDIIAYITNEGGFNMSYKINDNCISCGACEPECPVGAISSGDSKYEIDPDTCIDCGACKDTCPSDAIEE